MNNHCFELVDLSVLKIVKFPMPQMLGLAEHYYLSDSLSLNNSVGWGPKGLELQGKVRVTEQQLERIEQFTSASEYHIANHNCEHFVNYVLYGINFSSQQHTSLKHLGSKVIQKLQPVQSVGEKHNSFMTDQIARVLNENLRQAKIERARQKRIEFWKSRGIDVT